MHERVAVAAALALVLAVPTAAAGCGDAPVSSTQIRSIADEVALHVASAHAGSVGGLRADVAQRLRSLAEDRGIRTQRDLAYSLNGALAALQDAHLEVRLTEAAETGCRRLPVTFAWNAGGLWISASDWPAVANGSRIYKLGKFSPEVLEARLAAMLPHETPQWLRFHGARLLQREDLLSVLGLADGRGRLLLRWVAPDGSRHKGRIALQALPAAADLPWFAQRIDASHSTGLFRFDRFDYTPELAQAFTAFLKAADAAGVQKIALDIRGNPGGDSSVAVAMLDALGHADYASFAVEVRPSAELAKGMPMLMPEALNPFLVQAGMPAIPPDAATYVLPPPLVLAQLRGRTAATPVAARLPGRRLFLLTDGGTFSSGTLFVALVRDNRLGDIVGEAAGNTASFNGSELRLELPALDYYLNLSTARLWRPDVKADPAGVLQPDVVVIPVGADFAAGRDPALEAVLLR